MNGSYDIMICHPGRKKKKDNEKKICCNVHRFRNEMLLRIILDIFINNRTAKISIQREDNLLIFGIE